MTVYILGAGPTGLAIAHSLSEIQDIDFVVLEQESLVGGLAKTVRWGNHGYHDLGPHKIFSPDQSLMERVIQILPEKDWLIQPKRSSIFIHDQFIPYPPSPLSLVKVYGFYPFIQMLLDYIGTKLRSLLRTEEPGSFEEDLENRLGRGLYEALFKPIALKLWGDPTQLDVKLSKGRVQIPSLFEVIGRLLKIRASSEFEAMSFLYPKGGLQKLWDAILNKNQHQGSCFLNQEVTSIIVEDSTINKIRHQDKLTDEEREIEIQKDDFVFSTIPLYQLVKIMGHAITEENRRSIKEMIKLNDLILVFFQIDRTSLLDESWVFVPDPKIVFHRISEQKSFDPEMTPNGSIMCCEIMDNEMRPMSNRSDDDLIALARKGLSDMGYRGFSVLGQRVIRLPASYPVFRRGFEPVLEKILEELDRFTNFRTIGRQGAFNYIGTLDAMDIGFGAAKWFLNKREKNFKESWKEERQRTKHYPVLD